VFDERIQKDIQGFLWGAVDVKEGCKTTTRSKVNVQKGFEHSQMGESICFELLALHGMA
jgi:hypothetical protein